MAEAAQGDLRPVQYPRAGVDCVFCIDLTTDGREKVEQSRGSTRRSLLYWEGDQLVLDEKIELSGRTATNVVHYRLENEGKTLVARETFRGPKLQYDNVWVFDRK